MCQAYRVIVDCHREQARSYSGWSQAIGLIQIQAHAQAAGHARPALPRSAGVRAAEFLAVGFHRFQRKAVVVKHLVDGVMHHLIQLVGELLTDQLMSNQVGDSHVQGDQWLAKMLDVQVIDLFDEPVRQIGFVQQAVEPDVPGHDRRRLEEVLFGDFQHRFDLRLDTRFPGDFIGCIQQVRHFIDVGGDKTRQYAVGISLR